MATHAGMTTEEFDAIVKEWMATAKHPRFKRSYTEVVYQPMIELLTYLRANGFKTYIASAGGVEFMRAIAEKVYGVPPEQVIGSSIKTKFELGEGNPVLRRMAELDFIDEAAGKPVGIHKFIGRRPILAFGNSDGDLQMLQWTAAGAGLRFMGLVHHTDTEREWAYDRQLSIGKLDKALDEATAKGWVVVDMKNDWKRVFAFEQTGKRDPASSSSLDGVEWRLVEISGKPVAVSAGEPQPFVTFDATKKLATGYAGCNRFFGGYELEGVALKFGAIGATKRACPDLEEGVETEFFKVLDATNLWRIVDGTLELLSGDVVLARLHPHHGS
jgi:heat shock protein HslJ